MLAPDVRFDGFTHRDWQRIVDLFRPERPPTPGPGAPDGVVIAVHGDGRLRKLTHSRVGRLRLDDLVDVWPISARQLARRHDAAWALSIETGALEAVMEHLGAELRPEHGTNAQWLILIEGLREQFRLGRLDLWPPRLAGFPTPTAAMIDGSLDTLCPRGKAMLLGLFEGDRLWTSIALRRGDTGAFDLVLGPDALREELGLLSGDFRRDHRHLADAVTRAAGPLALGCFAEHERFRALEVDPTPGAWATAVAVRDVVLSPVPPGMALPLGLDAGRAAVSALRQVARRLGPPVVGAAGDGLERAVEAFVDVALGSRRAEEVLGFNPLELLRKLVVPPAAPPTTSPPPPPREDPSTLDDAPGRKP
ncbi:MAG: hypothetical protein AAGN82_05895 [Myxococcota bacterium]